MTIHLGSILIIIDVKVRRRLHLWLHFSVFFRFLTFCTTKSTRGRKKKILFHHFIFDFLIIRIHPILVVALFEKVAKSLRALLLLSRILHSSQLLEKRGNKKETQWSDVKFIWKMDVFIFKFYVIGLCLFSFYRTFNE